MVGKNHNKIHSSNKLLFLNYWHFQHCKICAVSFNLSYCL